jgi:hypothetical protein
MMARAALIQHAVEFGGIERLADYAGRRKEDFIGAAAHCFRGDLRGDRGRLLAGLAGEGIGVAGIDHQRAGLAALEFSAAPFDGGGGAFGAREHAGHRRALVHDREQHIGAALVADAGFRGREPDAGDLGHVGDVGRSERGNG